VFVLGGATNPGGGAHIATIAYRASDGTRLWVARSEGIDAEAYSMTVTPDGSAIVVAGTMYDITEGGTYNYLTVAYDQSTGAPLWQTTYDATRNDEYATHVAVAPDSSRVFVTGVSGPAYGTVAYTLQRAT
jgi:outer membrane protein assembly factor BamB